VHVRMEKDRKILMEEGGAAAGRRESKYRKKEEERRNKKHKVIKEAWSSRGSSIGRDHA
jgi:hypothetical protein